ncbi:MAG: hypothetical protein AB1505_20340 [Candidatus Latescibacterota bacterium]
MDRFWGNPTWRAAAYAPPTQMGLFDDGCTVERIRGHEGLVHGFAERLRTVASFKHVPEPLAMRNSTNSVMYYLFFASHNGTGAKIASEILAKYRN